MSAVVEAKTGVRPIFVYGSLMNEMVFSKVTGLSMPKSALGTLADYRRVQVNGKPYPACYFQKGASVQGMIISIDSEIVIHKLDQFESDLYKRITVSVSTTDGIIEADVYIWNKAKALLNDNDWDYAEFVQKRLPQWDEVQSESDL
jgi:gamma-glutamylcyclotransferase (GGCT)/AIG2-like uncharacterized protein YtfP